MSSHRMLRHIHRAHPTKKLGTRRNAPTREQTGARSRTRDRLLWHPRLHGRCYRVYSIHRSGWGSTSVGASFDHQFGGSLHSCHTNLRHDRKILGYKPTDSIITTKIESRRWILYNPVFDFVWNIRGKTSPSFQMIHLLTSLQTVTHLVPFIIYSQGASNTVAALHMLPTSIGVAVGGVSSGIIFTRCVWTVTRDQVEN